MLNVYNRERAAAALGVSEETIDRYKKSGKLSYRKLGKKSIRFTEGDLIEFLDGCAVAANRLPSGREAVAQEYGGRE